MRIPQEKVKYVAEHLAPEVLTAAGQFDGTVPTAPGDRAADRTDKPLVINTSELRSSDELFEN